MAFLGLLGVIIANGLVNWSHQTLNFGFFNVYVKWSPWKACYGQVNVIPGVYNISAACVPGAWLPCCIRSDPALCVVVRASGACQPPSLLPELHHDCHML